MSWKEELKKILDRPEIEPPKEEVRDRTAQEETTNVGDMDLSFLEVTTGGDDDDCKCDLCEKLAEFRCRNCRSILCRQHKENVMSADKSYVHDYVEFDCKPGWRDKL